MQSKSASTPQIRHPLEFLKALPEYRWFAYGSILLLQLRTFLYVWRRDLIDGDTAYYFVDAWRWHAQHRLGNLVYSPLYSIFYGSLLSITPDVTAVQILHRVLIVLAVGLLLLAVMRRLLPASIAWLVAAWWVLLPVNYDARFEVHLFAMLPVLAAWWVAAKANPTSWTRAAALGILIGAALLVRQELLVAAGCFALICVIDEIRGLKQKWNLRRLGAVALAYATPCAIVGLIAFALSARTDATFAQELEILRAKQHETMGQWYAFGYQQRHTDWSKNPWSDYPDLMTRDFGAADPMLAEMLRRNPRALGEHIAWHYHLLPNGAQLGLFGRAGGRVIPDIQEWFQCGSTIAWILSAILLALLCAGAGIWWQHPDVRAAQFRPHRLAWWAMACVLISAPLILLTSPARPEIFFCHTLVVMALVGAAAATLLAKLPAWQWSGIIPPVVLIAALSLSPLHYHRRRVANSLRDTCEWLKPHQSLIDRSHVVFLQRYPVINAYLGHSRGRSVGYAELKPDAWPAQESLADMLDRKGINLFCLDKPRQQKLIAERPGVYDKFVGQSSARGWEKVDGGGMWILFKRGTPQRPGH